jgi:hypothetical protein
VEHYAASPTSCSQCAVNGDDDEASESSESSDITTRNRTRTAVLCFLDEWFTFQQTASRCSQQPTEEAGKPEYLPERLASRRFATKVMFMAAMACPATSDKQFDLKD